MPGYYKLNADHSITELARVEEWAKSFDIDSRRVALDSAGDIEISTVFLGLDHSFGEGRPLLFETMIFGLPDGEEYQHRYSTWDEAVRGHAEALAIVKDKFPSYTHIANCTEEKGENTIDEFRKIQLW